MVLFTPKKLTFKRSKKQHQILAQTAYYQAGKIVVQTILPEQPPVALITLNTLGTTCSTSADTYIPIENIFNTQSCSFLESRLVSLYGGKAASLLIEYQQRLNPLQVASPHISFPDQSSDKSSTSTHFIPPHAYSIEDWSGNEMCGLATCTQHAPGEYKSKICKKCVEVGDLSENLFRVRLPQTNLRLSMRVGGTASVASEICTKSLNPKGVSIPLQRSASTATICNRWQNKEGLVQLRDQKLAKQKTDQELANPLQIAKRRLGNLSGGMQQSNCVNEVKVGSRTSTSNTETKLLNNVTKCRTCVAGAGNNIFQSTLGNTEIQTATRLARIMVNYWNFYSLNKSSLYSIFKKDAATHQLNALHSKASINKLGNFPLRKNPCAVNSSAVVKVNPRAFASVNPFANTKVNHYLPQHLPLRDLQQRGVRSDKQLSYCAKQNPLQIENGVRLPQTNLRLSMRVGGTARTASETCTKSLNSKGVSRPPQRSTRTPTICNRWQSKEKLVQLKGQKQREHLLQPHEESVAKELEAQGYVKRKSNVRVWGIKLKVKDKTLAQRWGNIIYKVPSPHILFPYQSSNKSSDKSSICTCTRTEHAHGGLRNNLYFAIAQSKNSLKICESSGTSNSSYNIQRLSIENIGNYSQLNNNNFQLINSLQFSNLQRDRFSPNWFRLYLPDMEATEFLKNVANYYFSLGLQTFTFPSTKFSYYSNAPLPRFDFGKLGVSIASPFLTFLNKNTQKEKFSPTIISYTYCPPSILVNFTSDKSINSRFAINDLIRPISHSEPTHRPLSGLVSTTPTLRLPRRGTEGMVFIPSNAYAYLRYPMLRKGALHTPSGVSTGAELVKAFRFSMRVGETANSNHANTFDTLLCKASASDYYKLYPRFNNFVIPPAIARVIAPAVAKVNPRQRFATCTSSFIPSLLRRSITRRKTGSKPTHFIPLQGANPHISFPDKSSDKSKICTCTEHAPGEYKSKICKKCVEVGDLSEDLSGVKVTQRQNNCLNEMEQQKQARFYVTENFTLQAPGIMGVDYIKDPSFTRVEGMSPTHTLGGKGDNYSLNVPFSLLLENQIFPLNYNGFSVVEKELLYNALVNSSFAKAFYLINQNRQLLDFLVDYLLRFQILRQHQILYLFSTLLLGCNRTVITT